MHVAVLGAGVVGVTTAYYLSKAGHTVTVIDREDEVAKACSFANGSQLSYSYTDAMATPAFLPRIPRLLLGLDDGFRFRPPLSSDLLHWGREFLAQCTVKKASTNMLHTLMLASRSRQLQNEIRSQLDSDFSYRQAGKLVLLPGQQEHDDALRNSALKTEHGCVSEVISLDEAIAIEPAIEHMTGRYHSAVYAPGDDVGDANAFTRSLARHLLAKRSCEFQMSTRIQTHCCRASTRSGNHHQPRATGHRRGCGLPRRLESAACSSRSAFSSAFIRREAIASPLPAGSQANSVSVTDIGGRFVVSRIGQQMRIAGFADFVGYNTTRDEKRQQQLTATACQRAPFAANYRTSANHAWGGFRPLTPDGRPVVGSTAVDGLYLNTGHGSLGWTLACASGELLASSMLPATESIRSSDRLPRSDNFPAIEQETA